MSKIKFKQDIVANYATYLAGVEYTVYDIFYTPSGEVCGVEVSQEVDVYDIIYLLDKEYRITDVDCEE